LTVLWPSGSVTLPSTALLSGSVRDDGLPPGAPLTIGWSLVSGPGAVTFSQPKCGGDLGELLDCGNVRAAAVG
jgi:hypothetical protein